MPEGMPARESGRTPAEGENGVQAAGVPAPSLRRPAGPEQMGEPEGTRGEDAGDAAAARPRRRGTHRRATGGSSPDENRSLGVSDWGDAAWRLGADAPDPRESSSTAGHEQWLREQRPPHWG